MMEVLDEFGKRGNMLNYVTIETNGTRLIMMSLLIIYKIDAQMVENGIGVYSNFGQLLVKMKRKQSKPEVIGRYAEVSPCTN